MTTIDGIQPVVLVGGASRRFGRDKLREPLQGRLLVDYPILALREVFGPRVLLVGDCHPAVAERGDGHIGDRWPGAGPLGGVVSALEHCRTDVLVIAGDMPAVHAGTIRMLMAASDVDRSAIASSQRQIDHIGVWEFTSSGELLSFDLSWTPAADRSDGLFGTAYSSL